MDGQVTIRPGAADDLPQVTEMWRELACYHIEQDSRLAGMAPDGGKIWRRRLGRLLDDSTFRLYVAEAEEYLIGFVTGFLHYAPEVFELQKAGIVADLYVAHAWRRQRVAQRLVAVIGEWFKEEKVNHIEMNVVSRNQAAVSFWRSMGAQEFMARMRLPVGRQMLRGDLRTTND
jgi:GNAT superfamily N-acetyltransferase